MVINVRTREVSFYLHCRCTARKIYRESFPGESLDVNGLQKIRDEYRFFAILNALSALTRIEKGETFKCSL